MIVCYYQNSVYKLAIKHIHDTFRLIKRDGGTIKRQTR